MQLIYDVKCAIAQSAIRGLMVATAVIVSGAPGCGPSHPPTAPVSAVIKCEGKPVAHAMVMFFPQGVTDAKISYGQTDADGRLTTVSTYGNGDGATVGRHNVSVTEAWPPDIKEIPKDNTGMEKSPPRGPWAAKYRDSTSGALQVEVSAEQENLYEFELTK